MKTTIAMLRRTGVSAARRSAFGVIINTNFREHSTRASLLLSGSNMSSNVVGSSRILNTNINTLSEVPDAIPGVPHFCVVLMRHGESSWNKENRFCSWVDKPLTDKGCRDAKECAKTLRKYGYDHFDAAYSSVLTRSVKSTQLVLEELDLMWVPQYTDWRLNERHYGNLMGMNKQESSEMYGEKQVKKWRRAFDEPLPPIDPMVNPYYDQIDSDPRYVNHPEARAIKGESLKEVIHRIAPYWDGVICQSLLQSGDKGRRVLVSGHSNSIRALMTYIEKIGEEEVRKLNIPNGIPIVYHFDAQMNLCGPANFLGDNEAIQRAMSKVANENKVFPSSSGHINIPSMPAATRQQQPQELGSRRIHDGVVPVPLSVPMLNARTHSRVGVASSK